MYGENSMNTLVAWFSWSGTTERIAEELARKTHGDLYQIQRAIPYSKDYQKCAYEEAKNEYEKRLLPSLKQPLADIGPYDRIVLAFPIWWYTAPMAVLSFLRDEGDWKGKEILVVADAYSRDRKQFETAVADVRSYARNAKVVAGPYNDEIDHAVDWL